MRFNQALVQGTLIKRYKRFLADVELDDGSIVTAHTPNTGSMLGCCKPGSPVWMSNSGNPKRKYALSWELVEAVPGVMVGINTGLPNKLIGEAIQNGTIQELQGYDIIREEVRYGAENSRIDLLLERGKKPDCYVEIKNVTLAREGIGYFPDAVSERGSKHLRELAQVATEGKRAVICFCVQRKDVYEVRPADSIDKKYGVTLRQAIDAGVEAVAWRAHVSTDEIRIDTELPVVATEN
ncbi:MAG: DNA/RNA nuclease SfsA [Gammaproteobacteria bacterium]|nr:DNA/RNA nuclease SfsA [Gammaproteobacteria bacterium]